MHLPFKNHHSPPKSPLKAQLIWFSLELKPIFRPECFKIQCLKEYLTQVPVLGVLSVSGLLQNLDDLNSDQLQHHEPWTAPKMQRGKAALRPFPQKQNNPPQKQKQKHPFKYYFKNALLQSFANLKASETSGRRKGMKELRICVEQC